MRVKTMLVSRAASFPENEPAVGEVEQVERADQLHHLQSRSGRDMETVLTSRRVGAKLFILVNDEQMSSRQYRRS